MAINPIIKFLNAARSLANQGMSKEAIEQFAKQEFGEINELFQKQIDSIFKPRQGIENIKIKDPDFDDTVIKMQFDEFGPFNPKDPLKNLKKQTEGIETIKPKKNPNDPEKFYTGGMVDVEPNLSDIGHGSDALMARTRLVAPNSQATTSTGLNYLLAEDNDNIRVPFAKGKLADAARRKFMKTAGGITAGIGALKAGLINLGEEAAPVAQKVMENFSSKASEAPGYFFDLVTKIKSFGKKSKIGPQERMDEYSYTGKNGDEYTLTEDIVTGDAQITKDKMGVGSSGDKTFDTINDRTVLEYKAPKKDVDVETQRMIDEGAEYEEYRVEFDQDGTQAGADAIDESVQKEIIEEAAETITKKSDGGRIGFSKGKLVFENAARFLNKVFGKENMAEMPNRDPEMYQGILEVVDMFRNRDKEGLIKYMRKFLPHKNDAEIEEFIIGSDGTEGIQGELIRLGSGRDYKEKIDMIQRLNERGKLRDLEITEEMIRKPNAEGGRAGFMAGGIPKFFKLAKKFRESPEYKKFIEKLFLKTSTDIRRGEGAFKNISVDEKIKMHDDLTKTVVDYQKTGELPESAHQYFGFNPEIQYAETLMQKQLKMTPEQELRQEFPGISDEMVGNILTDTNQQRIAEVKATMREALKMQEKGMGTDEIISTFKNTSRTKNASGGLAKMLGE
jgi:hypothetical protein